MSFFAALIGLIWLSASVYVWFCRPLCWPVLFCLCLWRLPCFKYVRNQSDLTCLSVKSPKNVKITVNPIWRCTHRSCARQWRMAACSVYADIIYISSTRLETSAWNKTSLRIKSLLWQQTLFFIRLFWWDSISPLLCFSCCWHVIMKTVFFSSVSKIPMSSVLETGGECK